MKKRWLALGLVALVGAGGYWTFQENKYRLPGLLQDWRDPVQDNRPVVWQQGPKTAPAGTRPPNIVLIVVDDMGWNDISLNGGGVAGGRGACADAKCGRSARIKAGASQHVFLSISFPSIKSQWRPVRATKRQAQLVFDAATGFPSPCGSNHDAPLHLISPKIGTLVRMSDFQRAAISAIEPGRRRGRFNVFVDGAFAASVTRPVSAGKDGPACAGADNSSQPSSSTARAERIGLTACPADDRPAYRVRPAANW